MQQNGNSMDGSLFTYNNSCNIIIWGKVDVKWMSMIVHGGVLALKLWDLFGDFESLLDGDMELFLTSLFSMTLLPKCIIWWVENVASPQFGAMWGSQHGELVLNSTGWWFVIVPFSWEWNNHPNWRSPSFFRGVGLNHQPVYYPLITINHHWSP